MPDNTAQWNYATQMGVTAANSMAAASMNRRTRKFQEEMMNRQREWSLADWHMQNEYNSPEQQMARLKAAGLNPNLIYGKGADNISGPIRSSPSAQWNPKAPDFSGFANGITAYQDSQVKQAQIDNLKAQNTVQVEDALLRKAQTLKTLADTDTVKFDLDLKNSLRENSLSVAQELLRGSKIQNDIALDRNEREQLLASQSLKKGVEEILTMRLQRAKTQDERANLQMALKKARYDEDLWKLDSELAKMNIRPSDPFYASAAARALKTLTQPTNGFEQNKKEVNRQKAQEAQHWFKKHFPSLR